MDLVFNWKMPPRQKDRSALPLETFNVTCEALGVSAATCSFHIPAFSGWGCAGVSVGIALEFRGCSWSVLVMTCLLH